jgi:hypothetical protein
MVREAEGINLTAGSDSRQPRAELPGMDINGIRQANICGPGSRIEAVVTQEGKRLWLTGQDGASAACLLEAMSPAVRRTSPLRPRDLASCPLPGAAAGGGGSAGP